MITCTTHTAFWLLTNLIRPATCLQPEPCAKSARNNPLRTGSLMPPIEEGVPLRLALLLFPKNGDPVDPRMHRSELHMVAVQAVCSRCLRHLMLAFCCHARHFQPGMKCKLKPLCILPFAFLDTNLTFRCMRSSFMCWAIRQGASWN